MRHSRVARSDDRERAARGRSSLVSAAAILFEFGFLFFLAGNLFAVPESSGIRDVSISRPFFNPTLGKKVKASFSVGRSGSLSLSILDRDGFLVRKLVSARPVQRGKLSYEWDGRDDHGEVVPDEAYSLKINLDGASETRTYFPANELGQELQVRANYYDRRGATLSYKLPKPARVHIQAGSARTDPKTKKPIGPVLKTLVNREPRTAGAVIETWNGLDESGMIRVSDLRNFVIAIAATALPENAIITVGNRKETFLESVTKRTGRSLFTFLVEDHHHHRGLAALDDVAPALRLVPQNAAWSASERLWRTESAVLKLSVSLSGPSAESFARQPGRLVVFLDQEPVSQTPAALAPFDLEVPIAKRTFGFLTVTVNWASEYGPVTVNSLRVRIGKEESSKTASKS